MVIVNSLVAKRIWLNPIRVWSLGLSLLLDPLALATNAHTVNRDESVAALIHIEPNDSPKASVPTQVWFGLTRQGGQIIPLEICECDLAIYKLPRLSTAEPIVEPELEAFDAERYRGIPGAEVIFPDPGRYQLQLQGQPKPGAESAFSNFTLNFEVTVGR